jgi:hypothetical protein
VSGEIIAGKSVGGNYGLQGEKMRVSVSYLGKSETQGGLWLTLLKKTYSPNNKKASRYNRKC